MLVLGYKGLLATSPEIRQMDEFQLLFEAESIRRRENSMSELLAKHLGTTLSYDHVKAYFTKNPEEEQYGEIKEEETEELVPVSPNFHIPLIFALGTGDNQKQIRELALEYIADYEHYQSRLTETINSGIMVGDTSIEDLSMEQIRGIAEMVGRLPVNKKEDDIEQKALAREIQGTREV